MEQWRPEHLNSEQACAGVWAGLSQQQRRGVITAWESAASDTTPGSQPPQRMGMGCRKDTAGPGGCRSHPLQASFPKPQRVAAQQPACV